MKKEKLLEKIYHGEDSSLQLSPEEASTITNILVKKGYAVCITGGDFEGEYTVSWCYAGTPEDLNFSDYGNICFSNSDWLASLEEGDYEE